MGGAKGQRQQQQQEGEEEEEEAKVGDDKAQNVKARGPPAGFLALWAELCQSEPDFAVELLKALQEKRPDLAEMCDEGLLELE